MRAPPKVRRFAPTTWFPRSRPRHGRDSAFLPVTFYPLLTTEQTSRPRPAQQSGALTLGERDRGDALAPDAPPADAERPDRAAGVRQERRAVPEVASPDAVPAVPAAARTPEPSPVAAPDRARRRARFGRQQIAAVVHHEIAGEEQLAAGRRRALAVE